MFHIEHLVRWKIMGWPQEELRLPDVLEASILEKKCVVFIGSGASVGCCPSWPEFVNKLCIACGSALRVRGDDDVSEFMRAADDAKNCNKAEYHQCLHREFRPGNQIRTIYLFLAKLPFKCYLTTNFDSLLVTAARLHKDPFVEVIDAYPNFDRARAHSGAIFYLHGKVDDHGPPVDGTIVLAQSEFDAAYLPTSSLSQFLGPTFENDDICFIGCRLKEPTMEQVFRICKEHQLKRQDIAAKRGSAIPAPPKRFILMDRPERPDPRDPRILFDSAASLAEMDRLTAFYRNFDIEIVWYNRAPGKHEALDGAFDRLLKLPTARIRP